MFAGKLNNKWVIVGLICALVGSMLGAYQLFASWKAWHVVNLPLPDCDLRQGPCVSTLSTGEKIELEIRPTTHMPILTSVQLRVKVDQIPVQKIAIFFKGAEMKMGEFRYVLLPQRDGTFSTQTTLPTCINERMIWHTVVEIETLRKNYYAPFVFINQRPLQPVAHR